MDVMRKDAATRDEIMAHGRPALRRDKLGRFTSGQESEISAVDNK
jgi:hypothetical protein